MFYVYILQSLKNNEFYKRLTDDVDRRITEHQNGKSRSTKHMVPLKLIYVHTCETRPEAREWEKFFKSGIGREVTKEIARVLEWQTGTA